MIDRARPRPHSLPSRFSVCLLGLVAMLVLFSPTVCAQDAQQTALARSLFEQGVTAADAGLWADAADRFERAYGLKPTAGIAFNWASALIELGRLVEAGERLRGIARDPAATPELSAEAQSKLALVTARIAYLTIHVQGPTQDVSVSVDGRPLPQAAWGAGSPTDPGGHTVTLQREGEMLQSESIVLGDAERRELDLRVPEAALASPLPVERRDPGSALKQERRPLYKSWVLWTAVGTVLVAGAVTTALLLSKDDPSAPPPVKGDTDPAVIKW